MFIDTSILIDVLTLDNDTEEFERIIELVQDHPLYISVLQFCEYSDWCYRSKLDPQDQLAKIKKLVNVLGLTEEICLEGSKIKYEKRKEGSRKFSLVDGIIAATSRSINIPILIKDSDFKNIEAAIVLDNFK